MVNVFINSLRLFLVLTMLSRGRRFSCFPRVCRLPSRRWCCIYVMKYFVVQFTVSMEVWWLYKQFIERGSFPKCGQVKALFNEGLLRDLKLEMR